jgi:hypothetical protein
LEFYSTFSMLFFFNKLIEFQMSTKCAPMLSHICKFQNLEVLKKWFLKGTFVLYRSNHIFLNSVIIHKTKVLLPHV